MQAVEFLRTQPVGESDTVRLFFWGIVAGSWVMTWVPQLGQRNFSTVDRLWPLMPTVYSLLWAYERYVADGHVLNLDCKAATVQGIILVWTIHQTHNFYRRGGFAVGSEDHRWAHVRARMRKALGNGLVYAVGWEVFNLGFIAVAQHVLLYRLSLPVRLLQDSATLSKEWSTAETALIAATVVALAVEIVADKQQFDFQQLKRQTTTAQSTSDGSSSSEDLERRQAEVAAGFVHSGLFKYSRHPNVFCEQVLWVALSSFALVATGTPVDSYLGVTYMGGALGLVLLTVGSVRLTESISASKYPLYRAFQIKTSCLVPCAPKSNESVIRNASKWQ